MKYRKLGNNGPTVSAVSQGRGATPVRFGDPLEAEFNKAIARAFDLGVNFFDSSDAYWRTRHEVLLGRALKGRRDAMVASKFGNIDLPDGKKATNGRPEYVYRCCDASVANVEQNAAAVDLALSAADLARLSDIFDQGKGAGERYMANVLKGVGL